MEHYFDLPIVHDGATQYLKGRLVTFAFDYKFYIIVGGQELTFEKDDHGQFRVINNNTDIVCDDELLRSIVKALKEI